MNLITFSIPLLCRLGPDVHSFAGRDVHQDSQESNTLAQSRRETSSIHKHGIRAMKTETKDDMLRWIFVTIEPIGKTVSVENIEPPSSTPTAREVTMHNYEALSYRQLSAITKNKQ
jgi:hypothetical protein